MPSIVELLEDLSKFKYYSGQGHVSNVGDFGQKEIKYGKDTLGGGTSEQSDFQNDLFFPPIPTDITPFGQDVIIRGGASLPLRTENDLKRFTNFITSPKGMFFIAKQEILARQQAKLPGTIKPTRIYNPVQTGLQVGGNAVGLHVLGKGMGVADDIVSFAKSIIKGDNPFEKSDSIDPTNRYLYQTKLSTEDGYNVFNKEQEETTNRLGLLFQSKILSDVSEDTQNSDKTAFGQFLTRQKEGFTNFIKGILNPSAYQKFGIDEHDNQILLKYDGGPNATVPGISNSVYKRVVNTTLEGQNKAGAQDKWKNQWVTLTSNQIFSYSRNTDNSISDFRAEIKADDTSKPSPNTPASKILAFSDYHTWNRTKTYGQGDPGSSQIDRTNFVKGGGSTGRDKVNWTEVTNNSTANDELQDLINFYITSIDNDNIANNTYIRFRAFLGAISDTYNSTWNPHKFMGRGENFFTYGGYARSMNLSFQVHAQTKQELNRMYTKLNYLASLCAPDYSPMTGFMRGNLIKLTIGDYLNDVPGILTSINYNISDQYPWDLGRDEDGFKDDLALPMLIDVSGFQFTPISEKLPSKVKNSWVSLPTSDNMNSPFISLGKENEGYNI